MPTAIVTGATGINGREIIHALSTDPTTWPTVHAFSRSQREPYPPHIHHDTIDLLSSADVVAKQLSAVGISGDKGGVDVVFFTAYLQRGDEAEMARTNGSMLRNFLEALRITGAEKALKRVVLTTGAKQYGVHLGPVKNPMEEEDPWLEDGDAHGEEVAAGVKVGGGGGFPPNFYYVQQRILVEMSKGKGWDWVVTYPNDVIGVAKGNFMNLTTALGLYAAVTKELNAPFIFPGSPKFYTKLDCFTYSRLHARFNLWAATEPRAGNNAFNVVNGDVQSWQTMWPRLAKRFGLTIPKDQFAGRHDDRVMVLNERPPLCKLEEEMGITGHVPRGEVRMHVDLTAWSQRHDVRQAWERLAEREGLQKDAFDKATWLFMNFVLGRNFDLIISMNKARRFGFDGWCDTWEALSECLDELEREKILPRRK